eukprot:c43631_g1_i1 orf=98-286(+)
MPSLRLIRSASLPLSLIISASMGPLSRTFLSFFPAFPLQYMHCSLQPSNCITSRTLPQFGLS